MAYKRIQLRSSGDHHDAVHGGTGTNRIHRSYLPSQLQSLADPTKLDRDIKRQKISGDLAF